MKIDQLLIVPLFLVLLLLSGGSIMPVQAQESINLNKFRQLKQELATPNVYRTASGAPGHQYWQQQADYEIELELKDDKQQIYGKETITYTNNSPDELTYLWVQLDQNVRAKDSDTYKVQTGKIDENTSFRDIKRLHADFDGGFKIDYVKDANDKAMDYTINKTMMRIDLPEPLKNGEKVSFKIKWWYNINNRMKIGGRSGYEYFEDDDNYLYTIAQFYPRMAVYNEVEGWQNKQFLGRGEFALAFGDYSVKITVPSDHIVASTGVLQNPDDVLTAEQKERYDKAQKERTNPVMIVTQEEAEKAEQSRATDTKTWHYKAENVRDFGFASSRKFIWDALGVPFGDRTVMAMSYYPKEGNPLWEQYSTKVVAHTLRSYSKHTFDYPYPVAISVHAKWIGMEYPMICFNFGRPEEDGTYNERTKYGMIGVIIHEVGHNYFPMIVNSDERQWTWMDEGLNTFVQYLTEQSWERDYPSRRGAAYKITDYMKGNKEKISPIMTNSESIHQFGNNAYGKPATALNILRETIMGRELFDYAFKEYSKRWMFKHPTPADFFRTMEDASGVDLDWFWRGWFYSTDHVDISLDGVKWTKINTKNPDVEKPLARQKDRDKPEYISDIRNKKDIPQTITEKDPSTKDFYNTYDPFAVSILDKRESERYYDKLEDDEKAIVTGGHNYYEMEFSNVGGLVMPVILEFTYTDGTKEVKHIPAEIWKLKHDKVSKIFVTKKEIKSVTLDPYLETADTDRNNNYWPAKSEPSRFELFKRDWKRPNAMQKAKRAQEALKGKAKEQSRR